MFHPGAEFILESLWDIDRGRAICAIVLTKQIVIYLRHRTADPAKLIQQRRTIRQAIEMRDIVDCIRIGGHFMGLAVIHHLEAVLYRAQPVIAFAEQLRIVRFDDLRRSQRIKCLSRALAAQRRHTSAINQLVRLRVELDFPNAAPPALDIKPRPWFARTIIGRTDTRGQPADFFDCSEIQALAPDKGADIVEKPLARRDVTRCRA